MADPQTRRGSPLRDVAAVFCKLGAIGFGGPAVIIGMLEEDVVRRRKWITRERLLDLVGATNIIPGPNAVEMCLHLGYVRTGWPGLFVAGAGFIGPAMLSSLVLAWAYVEYGQLPQVQPFLYGIKPAVLALILAAVWRLGKAAAKGWRLVAIGLAVIAAYLLGANEVLALLGGGTVGTLWLWLGERRATGEEGQCTALVAVAAAGSETAKGAAVAGAVGGAAAATVPLWKLGLFFLKVGAVMYGSGYVLVAFLQGDLVDSWGWLTHQEMLDAIAVGQFTPGPLLSCATFIGYRLAGVPGAVLATAAILLPSLAFVAILNPVLPRLRESRWASRFLDAVNISAVGLMLAVTARLGHQALRSWPAWVIAVAAGVAAIRFRVSAPWLVLGGSALGWALSLWAA
ncbi:MAG: chromate efflux transporter [Armatimonadota bacterium]|jgi:chromate transporter